MIESCITFLPVQDIEETTRFYTEIVGLSLWEDMGNCKIFRCGQGYWGFCQYDDGREMASGVCLSLNLKDTAEVDSKYQEIKTAGAAIKTAPQKHPNFPVYSFFVTDPNGYLLEFQKILHDEQ